MFMVTPMVHNKKLHASLQKKVQTNHTSQLVARQELDDLMNKLNELTLINHAMWGFLSRTEGITEENLLHAVEELRQKDAATKNCEFCGTVLQKSALKCYSCARDAKINSVFDVL